MCGGIGLDSCDGVDQAGFDGTYEAILGLKGVVALLELVCELLNVCVDVLTDGMVALGLDEQDQCQGP